MTVVAGALPRRKKATAVSGTAVARPSAGANLDGMREVLVGVAWRIAGDREQALDMVQDVYLAYLSAPEKFAGNASLKTYLYRMVINRCIDVQRRSGRFRAISELLGRERRAMSENTFDVKDMVRHLMSGIKPLYRVPFVLAEGDGMSYEEIAVILEISVNTVRSRIFRCREQLRKKIISAGYPL